MKKLTAVLLICLLLAGCAPSPAPAETVSCDEELTLFLPDANAEHLVPSVVMVPEIREATILDQLKWADVLKDEVQINRVALENQAMSIDFNTAFAQQVSGMGTAGEYMIMGSVVNTFLRAYGAKQVTITVDGDVLETGHAIYDWPLTFFE